MQLIKLEHTFRLNCPCRHHKTDRGKQLARMSFGLGDDPARFAPAFGLIAEDGMVPFNMAE